MADVTNSESTSPSRPVWSVHPVQFRDTIQKQIQYTVDNSVNAVVDMSNGNIDGRFLLSEPVSVRRTGNNEGYYYHIIGESTMGDISIAAP